MPEVNERRERLQVALGAAVDALHGISDEQRDDAQGGAELLERVVAYAQVVVEQTDPELITDGAVSGIETAADGIVANLIAAISNPRGYADNLLGPIAALPAARDRDVEQAVKEAAANFQRSATQRLKAVEADVAAKRAEVDEELAKLRTAVEERSTTTQAEIESLSTAFEAKLTEFESTLTTQRQTLDEMVTRHSDAFSEKQEERATTFEDEIAKARQQIASMIEASSADVERHVDEIRRMEEESAGLVGAIGLAGTAERYGEEQAAQKGVADRMRNLTIAFALGAVGMAIFAVIHEAEDNSAVAAKLGVSLVFGVLAAYTAKQSGRHRVREERARSLQLELTAFSPFIKPLDKDQQDFERVIMARKTFGQIRALPEAEEDHAYGPLGPVLDKLRRRQGEDAE